MEGIRFFYAAEYYLSSYAAETVQETKTNNNRGVTQQYDVDAFMRNFRSTTRLG